MFNFNEKLMATTYLDIYSSPASDILLTVLWPLYQVIRTFHLNTALSLIKDGAIHMATASETHLSDAFV